MAERPRGQAVTEIQWTDAEREAVRDELSGSPIGAGYYTTQVGTDEARDMADEVLEALAPHVAAREAQAAAKALREAAEWADNDDVDEDGERAHLYNGDVGDWLRAHADRIERAGDRRSRARAR